MTLRRAVNKAVSRATGYRLVRAGAGVQPPARPAKPPPPARPAKRARPKDPPKHVDEVARRIIEEVRPRTMTSDGKLFALIVATRYVVDYRIPGDIVECGVWRGGSIAAIARTLVSRGDTGRALHLFDTFEGMPPPDERDRRHDGRTAAALLSAAPRDSWIWAEAGYDDVRAGMDETGYPRERVHLHRGRVEDTVPEHAPAQIALLRLDTDWYESTRHELEHLYDRVPSGGVIVFDDYGYWQGAREAVDEFLERSGERLLLVPSGSGRIAVKP